MKDLWELYWVFARMGAVTFGGGYAMLPILQHELVEKRGWTTENELADYFAIGQCTPGVIAVNTATFIGNKRRGVAGGVLATLGVVSPSIVIIALIAAFISNFADLALVQNAFAGVRVCVCVMVVNAVRKLAKKSVIDKPTLLICLAVFAVSVLTPLSPALLVLAAGVMGVVIHQLRGDRT